MLAQEASAGLSAASMQCRCMPLHQKSDPPRQHDDSGRPPARLRIGGAQPLALRGVERAVVEIEMQIADGAALLVADLAQPADSPHRVGRSSLAGQGIGESAEREQPRDA